MEPIGITSVHQIAVKSLNLDTSIAFYKDVLGARFIQKFDPPGLGFLDIGGVRLLLEKDAPSATVYYTVENIEAAVGRAEAAGVSIESKPHLIFKDDNGDFGAPGVEEWMAFFRDPDNNLVGLTERR